MIARIITNPYPVWDRIKTFMEDDNGGLRTYDLCVGVFDGEEMAGAFSIRMWTEQCYEIHGGVHPDFWGNGFEVCDTLGRALFSGTACLKIVAIIPEFNRLMRQCLLQCGLKEEGRIERAFLKRMKLHDLLVFGICKSDMPERK